MKKNQPASPGSSDLAKHPTLWGHPLPAWGDTMVYAGGHWDEKRYGLLVEWLGRVRSAAMEWVYGPDRYRETLTNRARTRIAFELARREGHVWPKIQHRVGTHLNGDIEAGILPVELPAAEADQIEQRVAHAEKARKHLWSIASQSKHKPGTMTELAQWLCRSPDLCIRLGHVDLVPKPPADVLPPVLPVRGPTRQAKLDSKPTANPDLESVF